MFPAIVGLIIIIAIILFLVFAAKKKSKGEDLGEPGKKL
jgi:hypothetical protein